MDTNEKPRYRVKELSLIGQGLVEKGIEIDFEDLPGSNLEPLNDAARAKQAEGIAVQSKQRAELERMYGDKNAFGDPEAFAAAVVKAVTDANASLRTEMDDMKAQFEAMGLRAPLV